MLPRYNIVVDRWHQPLPSEPPRLKTLPPILGIPARQEIFNQAAFAAARAGKPDPPLLTASQLATGASVEAAEAAVEATGGLGGGAGGEPLSPAAAAALLRGGPAAAAPQVTGSSGQPDSATAGNGGRRLSGTETDLSKDKGQGGMRRQLQQTKRLPGGVISTIPA